MGDVSAIIPAFNAAEFVAAAVASALAQGERIREVVVVDDGSTDDTAEVARSAGARVLQRENGGIGAARNSGVASATGDLIAFLDADDEWQAGRLDVLLRALDQRPMVDAVFGEVVEFGAGREDSPPAAARLAGTMLIRRGAFLRVGPFREDVRLGEFVDWWARAEECGIRARQVPGVVLRRRIHTTNSGIVHAGSRADYVRVLREALHRRRGAS
jgi:glycosyltransferase involved in cell wall biosynthesis